jgi:hypothetical protein
MRRPQTSTTHSFADDFQLCAYQEKAQRFLAGNVEAELAERDVNVIVHKLAAGSPVESA